MQSWTLSKCLLSLPSATSDALTLLLYCCSQSWLSIISTQSCKAIWKAVFQSRKKEKNRIFLSYLLSLLLNQVSPIFPLFITSQSLLKLNLFFTRDSGIGWRKEMPESPSILLNLPLELHNLSDSWKSLIVKANKNHHFFGLFPRKSWHTHLL